MNTPTTFYQQKKHIIRKLQCSGNKISRPQFRHSNIYHKAPITSNTAAYEVERSAGT